MKYYQAKHLRVIGNSKQIFFAAFSALVLTVLCYFVNNLPIFTDEDLHQHLFTQKVCEWLGFKTNINYDDALFVNVAFDKELVPAMSSSEEFQ